MVASFEALRRQAEPLSGEIARDLESFTVHDISHIDALWGIADIIAGDNIRLNPLEAYLFGSAVICHDLAMTTAAYPRGVKDVDQHPLFLEGHAALFPEKDRKVLTSEECRTIRAWVIRENHASQASQLPLQQWRNENTGSQHYLIEDTVLRESFGHRIGRFAQSHWWPLTDVERTLSHRIGAAGGMPPDWTIDEFKIAALLRAADAAHIDQQRAPSFLFTLRHLHGVAAHHWKFQSLLQSPVIQGTRLLYSSVRDFTVDDADAWWLCYETINMINAELTAIDASCDEHRADLKFAARGVVGANEPSVLSRYVTIAGWFAVDAKPAIGDVPALIKKLGGYALYGNEPLVPLRELLQNAVDAIEALKIERSDVASQSSISCSLLADGEQYVLTVSDDGVGMSRNVILHALLDFGASLWQSELLRREFPRLAQRRFRSIGKFGIGFFSVFMWAQRVKLITRRYDARADETLVLEFGHELQSRPVLRAAMGSERRYVGGTSVQLTIANTEFLRRGRTDDDWYPKASTRSILARAVFSVLPFPLVPIHILDGDETWTVPPIEKNTFSAEIVLPHLRNEDVAADYVVSDEEIRAGLFMRPIIEADGEISGFAALPQMAIRTNVSRALVVTHGGMLLAEGDFLPGVFFGEPLNAARNRSRILCSNGALEKWAAEQIRLLVAHGLSVKEEPGIAAQAWAVGANIGDLKVALSSKGLLSLREIAAWAADHRFVVVISNYHQGVAFSANEFFVEEGVLVVGFGTRLTEYFADGRVSRTIYDEIERLVAAAWAVSPVNLRKREDSRYLIAYGMFAGATRPETEIPDRVLFRKSSTKLPSRIVFRRYGRES